MRVDAAGQTNQVAAYASAIPQASRSVRASSAADLFIVALWSGIGLALTALFALSSSSTMAEIFDVAVGIAG